MSLLQKKVLSLSIIVLGTLAVANFASAWGNLLPCNSIRACILMMVDNLIDVVVGVTVVVIILAGMMYLFSGANIELAEKAKKTLLGAVVGFAIVLGSKFIITEVGCALGWTGATGCGVAAKSMITRMITFLFSIVGIIALIGIIIGGILHIGSAGDESRAKSAKKILVSSIIGLVIALLSATIVRQLEKIFLAE